MSFIAFLLAMALSAASMPAIIEFARVNRLFDRHDERKLHGGDIPRLGGLGIAFAFIATIVTFSLLESTFRDAVFSGMVLLPLIISALMIHVLGLVDDFRNLRAALKFAIQLASALLVMLAGYRFKVILIPWGDGVLNLGLFSWPLTLGWIIGVTNAVNLIDGADGLAATISGIASAAFGVMMVLGGERMGAVLCFSLSGAILGFFIYNKPKARIFMGDSGSLFLGFCLAVFPLLRQTELNVNIGFLSAMTVLAVPILDTLSAIWRRTRAGVSFFTGDRGHVHHRLMALGVSDWGVLGIAALACTVLSIAAISTLLVHPVLSFSLKAGFLVLCAVGIGKLNGRKL